MPVAVNSLPSDVAELQAIIRAQHEEIQLLRAKMFGRKSEKWTAEDERQARLFDEAESLLEKSMGLFDAQDEKIQIGGYKRAKAGRRPIPDSLPRREIIHDIAEDEKNCACGAIRVRIGAEISEKLDIVPQKIMVEKHIRLKYACKKCEGSGDEDRPAVLIAPTPEQIIPKSLATPGLLAHVLTAKFLDHLPLYRQERIFLRMGIELTRKTMSGWAIAVAERCSPLVDLLRKELQSGPVIHCDETTLQVMREPGRKNTTQSYMWVMRGGARDHPVVLYEYQPTRSARFLKEHLKGYRGCLLTDGYTAYDEIGDLPGIVHAGCWAHARRKFTDARKADSRNDTAIKFLALIASLYKVETKCRDEKLTAEQILGIRTAESLPVVQEIFELVAAQIASVPPKSLLGKSLHYLAGEKKKLLRFLEDGNIPIDNNVAENDIRPFVLGRKNWLFSGSPRGARASAILYTLILNARANGLEPYWYLRFLFNALPSARTDTELRELLPQFVCLENIKAA